MTCPAQSSIQASIGYEMDHEVAIAQLLELMENFTALVKDENQQLARGLPASPQSIVVRKNEMADRLEVWAKAAAERKFSLALVRGELQAAFASQLGTFQAAMNENVRRIEAAMDASRRRIDAVMSAVREEIRPATPYGANGRPYRSGAGLSVSKSATI